MTTKSAETALQAKILVVEDESMLRMLVETILQSHGYNVQSAGSGEEAFQVWRQNAGQFDLLLTDMVLPDGVTGRNIAAQLQAESPSLKVVYSSGFGAENLPDEGDAFVEGLNFLQKPFSSQNLAKTVRQCLEHCE